MTEVLINAKLGPDKIEIMSVKVAEAAQFVA